MEPIYRTSQVAEIIGIHPNTVRLYEQIHFIPKPERMSNGYRIYTDFHIEQFRLARTALKVEVLQNGLRKKIIKVIQLSADGKFQEAISGTYEYISQVEAEQKHAEEAITIAKSLLFGEHEAADLTKLTRQQTATYLEVTIDTLRNWELNGLLAVKRRENGYRVYTGEDLKQLKIIRSLRCANYSLEAILRMLKAISLNPETNIKKVLDTPQTEDDIISVCDKLITSLQSAKSNALHMLLILEDMQSRF